MSGLFADATTINDHLTALSGVLPAGATEIISEQVAILRVAAGKIVSITGYYDTGEFHRVFWDQ